MRLGRLTMCLVSSNGRSPARWRILTVMSKRALVSVVDDDESVRESLPDLLRQFGFAAQAFSSAEGFLASEVTMAARLGLRSTPTH